jgi:HEAT repeat protein
MLIPLGVALLLALPRQTPSPSEKGDPPADKGLLGIAEREAARSAKLLQDRTRDLLRQWVMQHQLAADRGKSFIDAVVNSGPDAAPLLLGFVNVAAAGQGDASIVQPAARALVGLAAKTQNQKLLKSLADATKGAPASIRADVLAALESIDDEIVVAYASPMLDDETPNVVTAAIRALGQQKSRAAEVAKLLRPQFQKEKGSPVELLKALYILGDRPSVDLALGALGGSQDPQLVTISLQFAATYGGKNALGPLEALLGPNRASNLDDALLRLAVDAVQTIGLREIDSKSRAQEILVSCMNKHPSPSVRDRACWQLGPYLNDAALKRLEEPVLKDIAANSKATPSRPNTSNYINLAEYRLRFESWSKAIEALNKAHDDDEKGFHAREIDKLRAVALCGQDKLPAAKKILETLTAEERAGLFSSYPVLEKLLQKYRDLFPGK